MLWLRKQRPVSQLVAGEGQHVVNVDRFEEWGVTWEDVCHPQTWRDLKIDAFKVEITHAHN